METWWRMEERDGVFYVQSEVASLTRTFGWAWVDDQTVCDRHPKNRSPSRCRPRAKQSKHTFGALIRVGDYG